MRMPVFDDRQTENLGKLDQWRNGSGIAADRRRDNQRITRT